MNSPHHSHDHDHDESGCCQPRSQQALTGEYTNHGICFRFPSDWTLTEQSTDEEITVSVQSDGTSFWTLMLFPSKPAPEAVLETVVTAFEQDYDDVDIVSAIDRLAGVPSLRRDLDFVCFDLVNSATAYAFEVDDLTVLVLYQGTDHELVTTRDQLQAITASLRCDEEDD